MSNENAIVAFKNWARNLAIPPDTIPDDEALKHVLKSPQRKFFLNMMARVRPRQEVLEVRQNILINKMKKLKGAEFCNRSLLPKEMELFMKVQELQKKKEEVESRVAEQRSKCQKLASSIKAKNIQRLNLEQNNKLVRARIVILELKSLSLDKKLQKEKANREKILETMPVALSNENCDKDLAMEAVEKALKELETFYNLTNFNENAKNELWQRMRSTFSNIPNFLIYNAILQLKENQLQNMKSLYRNTPITSAALLVKPTTSSEQVTSFELKLMKTKCDLLGLMAKILQVHDECVAVDQEFCSIFKTFTEQFQRKVELCNPHCKDTQDIVALYLHRLSGYIYQKSIVESFIEQIDDLKAEIENGKIESKSHETLLATVKKVYDDINTSVNRIQSEMQQMEQIKDKIRYSKDQLAQMFTNTTAPSTGNLLSVTPISICYDSFNVGTDNVLCSTQLDMDVSNVSANNTIMKHSFLLPSKASLPNNGGAEDKHTMPPYLLELNTFVDVPLEIFNCMPKECSFYFSANPLVTTRDELSSVAQLAPGHLLTPFGALEEVRNRIAWADVIANRPKDLKLNFDLITVDAQALKQKQKDQDEHITELLDKINVIGDKTNYILQRMKQLYDFWMENPLRRYIPSTKTLNDRSYSDYETEFLMYYRMVVDAANKN